MYLRWLTFTSQTANSGKKTYTREIMGQTNTGSSGKTYTVYTLDSNKLESDSVNFTAKNAFVRIIIFGVTWAGHECNKLRSLRQKNTSHSYPQYIFPAARAYSGKRKGKQNDPSQIDLPCCRPTGARRGSTWSRPTGARRSKKVWTNLGPVKAWARMLGQLLFKVVNG